MIRVRLIAFIVFTCLLQCYSYAQGKGKNVLSKVSPGDFELPANPIIDSNSNAVILADIGSVHFVGNKNGWFSYVFKRLTRIKIINKKAFNLATVHVSLYSKDEHVEKMDDLVASTYNLENGSLVETKMDKNEVFEDKIDRNHIEKRFTMPAVKEGSIIEYTYTVTSDRYFSLPLWEFQSREYPVLWSEYNVVIPQTLFYVFVKHGVHTFAIDKGSEGHEAYMLADKRDRGLLGYQDNNLTVSANTLIHRWGMKDIPAFHTEPYLSSPSNYIDRIEFQLSGTYNGQDKRDVMNTWAKATEDLLKQEDFGMPLQEDNNWLNGLPDKITENINDPLEQAKAIYYYMNSHFTCTNYYNPYIRTTLKDVLKKNSGTVGDINLLLVLMLRAKNIAADPVLLSTRDHGFNSSSYPMMSVLNYVIARVKIGGRVYYLDAAHAQLGFGRLAGNCYNGHARIISEKDSGSVYFWTDSLKETKMTMVMISAGDNGRLEGSYQSSLGEQDSYNVRRLVSKEGEKTYFKQIQTAYGEDLDISNTSIDSLYRLEYPLKVHYDFVLKQAPGSTLFYFNPLFAEAMHSNPFKAAKREYPVEMTHAIDYTYIFNMDVPEGYVVEDLPKSVKVSLNGDQGSFEYLTHKEDRMVQLQCRIRLNKTYFLAEDYNSLRDFYAFIVKKEGETIVLKKQP